MTDRGHVAVVGSGYVGLTTAACLSHLGHTVVGADIDVERVAALNEGRVPILEAGLEELVKEGLNGGHLRFVVGAAEAAANAEFVFLCVPTPQGPGGAADLSFIETAARQIAPVLEPDAIVINKSTVPVGAAREVQRFLGREDVSVVSNPEFLREGTAVHDFLHPDRVVIGADDQSAAIRVASLYLGLSAPLVVTDPTSAETIKYVSNAFLATKISFVNAVAAVCEAVGADISDVTLGMGYDRRIGSEFLRPGPGWGGSCFGKDTKALVRSAADAGYDFALLRAAVDVNHLQFDRVVDKAAELCGGAVAGRRIAVLGLTFKARTDDLRDSPSLAIIERLLAQDALVSAYDPTVAVDSDERRPEALRRIELHGDAYGAVAGADLLIVATEWDEFRWLDYDKVSELMASKAIVDARNLLDRRALDRRGFTYRGIGRS